MSVRRPQEPGGRKIRHVVLTSPEEEQRLQHLAEVKGVTVARLLVESTLGTPGLDYRLVLREISGLRRDLVHASLMSEDVENSLAALQEKLSG